MTRRFEGGALVLATHNKGKLAEIAAMFEGRGIRFTCAADHGLPAPAETGATFLENASIKALAVARATGLPALADDSGLCVYALGGAPGVHTADWAETGPGGARDFMMAMQRVHDELGDAQDRRAAFVCCLALAFPDGHVESAQARTEGEIAWPPRGGAGFGYDPCFVPEGSSATYAEMDADAKKASSHRTKAFALMMEKCF